MTAKNQNFTISQGSSTELVFDPVLDASGGDVNLNAYDDLVFMVFTRQSTGTELFTKRLSSNDIIISGSNNQKAEITISSADTGQNPGYYQFEFWAELNDGTDDLDKSLAEGVITIQDSQRYQGTE